MDNTSKYHKKTLAFVAISVTIIELINLFSGGWLNQFSLIPRSPSHLVYIFTSPFLHGSLAHFLSNIIPLLVFSFLLMQYSYKRYLKVTFWLFVLTGLLVWLFARDARHIGASGIVYGYFGYLLLAGLLSKKLSLIFISLFVGFFYGGMVWGVLPIRSYISWESHLFGFVSGLFLAWEYRNKSL